MNQGQEHYNSFEKYPKSFPPGAYYFRISIDDIRCSTERWLMHLKDDQFERHGISIEEESRQVHITSKIPQQILRILNDPETKLDELAIPPFIDSTEKRGRRKACLLNILCVMAAYSSTSYRLIDCIEYVFFADTDRFYAKVNSNILNILPKYFVRDIFVDRSHKSVVTLASKKFKGIQFSRRLSNFRQRNNPSLQFIIASEADASGGPSANPSCVVAEVDIDLGNWLYRPPVGLIIHVGEMIVKGKTDHFRLWNETLSQNFAKNLAWQQYVIYNIA